ncbi:MAG: sensor histidine kinase N-terminal domain-containing protein, partial [Pseudomonadota bacterium]
MTQALSLRMRLTLIILCPLLLISLIIGLWQLDTARRTAADVFDRSLLTAALAVSNDVTLSGGDALSARTREILSDTSGGLVYYHVYAPDGVIVAGYATPPVGIPPASAEATSPYFFEGRYFGRDVIGVRLQNRAQIDGFSGVFTTTVWQNATLREAFMAQLVTRSLVTICGLIGSVALVVWFGVHLGLRPLVDLQEAIARRSSDELSPIRRAVPAEVAGIVGTLNRLFGQVSRSFAAQSDFISNAAHQLRNPIAGVLSLAEAVHRAPDLAEARRRAEDLLGAARETADLTDKLLTLERAKAISPEAF